MWFVMGSAKTAFAAGDYDADDNSLPGPLKGSKRRILIPLICGHRASYLPAL